MEDKLSLIIVRNENYPIKGPLNVQKVFSKERKKYVEFDFPCFCYLLFLCQDDSKLFVFLCKYIITGQLVFPFQIDKFLFVAACQVKLLLKIYTEMITLMLKY